MTNQELEKIFDVNYDRVTKHHGNAMSREKFIEVVSKIIEIEEDNDISDIIIDV